KEGIEVDYHESPGTHDWKFWNEYLEPAVKWMLQ
ncbi:MAG: acetylesterase, partial [Lachnospiraceae bacterium]|nr:acetylesterase [Lachnospiraceae bacterium]MCI9095390.1 acetylesterase [Lachnospiraceae bacterium]